MRTGFDLATVGDNCIDRFLPPVGLSAVGGNAVNVAVHLVKHGHNVAYFGAVGADDNGRRTILSCRENSIDTGHLRIVEGGVTAYTDIATHPDGDREMVFEEFGVCSGYTPDAAEIELLRLKRHVHIGWFDDGGRLKRLLAGHGISVSQDLTVNTDPRHVTADALSIAFSSAGPSREKAETLAAQSLAAGARIAVVTCGALGSLAHDGVRSVMVGTSPVAVSDTTGAGDTFVAGFLDAHLRGLDLTQCLEAGRDAAAITCTHFGGFPQTPQRL